ncbi:MAG: hypothetical protein GVY02_06620 [Bacteroidetes bacterium]|jgi:ribose/xylose/arabinose/galactoside ABC-type transport system permease subunit|nr:hypothetical protein [Bacteroidota bacterium]
MKQYGLYIFFGIVLVGSSLFVPNFLSTENIQNLLRFASALGVVAIGQTIVMVTGEFDLSVGSTMTFVAVISADIMDSANEHILLALLAGFGLALLIGLINGLLVTKGGILSFIVTLAMMIGLEGAVLLYTGGVPQGGVAPGIRTFGRGELLGIPIPVINFGIVAGLAIFLMRYTTAGRRLYAVGGNSTVAYLVGINHKRVILFSFIGCSLVAALAAFMQAGYIGMVDPNLGRGYELDSIAASVLGGTVIGGGKGDVEGTVVGVLLMIILYNIISLLNMNVETRMIIQGLLIIGAISFYKYGDTS